MLDEMMAPEAIPEEIPGGSFLREEILRLHEDFGFRLYGRAYSRHYYSAASIPNLLNYEFSGVTSSSQAALRTEYEQIRFFDDMAKRGYDVVVYQTSHLNF